mmetsp:Transcript_1077/g.3792  ORF Transcript_1077/g.3792 Transcript_1077/m.3792 type:complete len:221 (-) Transcript_1077:36-698(-)
MVVAASAGALLVRPGSSAAQRPKKGVRPRERRASDRRPRFRYRRAPRDPEGPAAPAAPGSPSCLPRVLGELRARRRRRRRRRRRAWAACSGPTRRQRPKASARGQAPRRVVPRTGMSRPPAQWPNGPRRRSPPPLPRPSRRRPPPLAAAGAGAGAVPWRVQLVALRPSELLLPVAARGQRRAMQRLLRPRPILRPRPSPRTQCWTMWTTSWGSWTSEDTG